MYIIGPIKQLTENTKYYSGKPPQRLQRSRAGGLPHVTIQMPVYKEGLEGVIMPTIRSMKAAMSTYEMQGGTCNIFINDDGMQLIPEDERLARQEFYDEHNIGWVARPKHNPKPAEGQEVFLRRGKFKKASNMNYALWVSNRVEERLLSTERTVGWTLSDESEAYRKAVEAIVEEDQGRTWADGKLHTLYPRSSTVNPHQATSALATTSSSSILTPVSPAIASSTPSAKWSKTPK